jgi:hypothetical protein
MIVYFCCFGDDDATLMYVSRDTTTSGDEVLLTNVRFVHCSSYVEIFHGFVEFLNFSPTFSDVAKLTGEFTSLEEQTEDPDTVIVLALLADGSGFAGSERRVEPKDPTQKLRLPIVNSISWFLSTSGLLLAKSEKLVEFMIPTPRVPTVGAN